MNKQSKRTKVFQEKVDAEKLYPLKEAIEILKEVKATKFDESVDVALRLGVDTRKAEQMVRGTCSMPNGLGKEVRVLVFAKADKAIAAQDAGADYVGGEEYAKKIQEGWLEFDRVVATPDMMAVVGRIGKILGPRGLMPNPKVGTVTFEVESIIKNIKAGQVEFRADKQGNLHLVRQWLYLLWQKPAHELLCPDHLAWNRFHVPFVQLYVCQLPVLRQHQPTHQI